MDILQIGIILGILAFFAHIVKGIIGGIIGSKILGIIVGLGFQLFIMNSFSEDF